MRGRLGLKRIGTWRRILRAMSENPRKNSEDKFDAAGLQNVPKSTRDKVPREKERNISSIKRPPMNAKHSEKRVQWTKNYMKLPTKNILFTDESRATLDILDNCSKQWVIFGHRRPTRIRRQQGGRSIIKWALDRHHY